MNIQKRESIKQQSTRKLKHKIDHNIIIFTLECQNLLRVCAYDERRVTQIYQGIFYGDCLPNDAKTVFQSISQLFEFLEMNFAAMVSIKQKQAIIVDMNKIRIPCKFELPFIMQVYPVVEDIITTLQTQNQQLARQLRTKNSQLEQTKESLNKAQVSLQKAQKDLASRAQLLKQQADLREQAQNGIQSLIQKIAKTKQHYEYLLQQESRKTRLHSENSVKFSLQNQQLNRRIQQLTKQLKEVKQIVKNKKGQIKQLQQYNNTLQQQLATFNSKNSQPDNNKIDEEKAYKPNQQKSIDQIITQFESNKGHQIKSAQKNISPQKKPNPFTSGLFIKNTLIAKPQSTSRFHKLLQFQSNGECNLNLSKRLLKDADIEELVKHEWPNVCRLNLSENIITGKGLETLFDHTWQWAQLKSLSLSSNKISEFTLNKLNFAAKAPRLMLIDLNFNPISNQTHKQIVEHNRSGKQPKVLMTVQKMQGQSLLSSPRFFSGANGFK